MFGKYLTLFLVLLILLPCLADAQKKDRVETDLRLQSPNSLTNCKELKLGTISLMPAPKYPVDARSKKIGGTIEVTVKIDGKGKVTGIDKVSGNSVLQGAAIEAAYKAKFNPTYCDGQAISGIGVLTYNFIPASPNEKYFTPTKIEDFQDITRDSPYFESILDLTENYQITFGYGDRRYYSESPLTRGDFAHFLRLTLELLHKRAEIAKKNPLQIGLYKDYNSQNLTSPEQIKDLLSTDPFSDSVKVLLLTYNIEFVSKNNEFNGNGVVKYSDLMNYWKEIFGEDSIPINFISTENTDKIVSRGEFALYLQESLQILTYKLLP